jgi:cell division protein FtsW (lipid II flippase)
MDVRGSRPILRAILHGPVVVVVLVADAGAAMVVVAVASAVVVVAGMRRTMRHTADIGGKNMV